MLSECCRSKLDGQVLTAKHSGQLHTFAQGLLPWTRLSSRGLRCIRPTTWTAAAGNTTREFKYMPPLLCSHFTSTGVNCKTMKISMGGYNLHKCGPGKLLHSNASVAGRTVPAWNGKPGNAHFHVGLVVGFQGLWPYKSERCWDMVSAFPAAEMPHFSVQTSSGVLLPSPAGTILGVQRPMSSANGDQIDGSWPSILDRIG